MFEGINYLIKSLNLVSLGAMIYSVVWFLKWNINQEFLCSFVKIFYKWDIAENHFYDEGTDQSQQSSKIYRNNEWCHYVNKWFCFN